MVIPLHLAHQKPAPGRACSISHSPWLSFSLLYIIVYLVTPSILSTFYRKSDFSQTCLVFWFILHHCLSPRVSPAPPPFPFASRHPQRFWPVSFTLKVWYKWKSLSLSSSLPCYTPDVEFALRHFVPAGLCDAVSSLFWMSFCCSLLCFCYYRKRLNSYI